MAIVGSRLSSLPSPLKLSLFVAMVVAATSGCKDSTPTQKLPDPIAIPGLAGSGSAQAGSGSSIAGSAAGSAAVAVDPWLQDTPKVKQPMARPLFWSAEKDGKTTYLLGTMHIGIDAESRLPDLVWTKLDAAPFFAMETNLNEASVGELKRSDGGTLHKDLGDVYWKKLENALTPKVALGLDLMKPMVAATMLSLKGLPETAPMDGILLGRAINGKKQIVYLEPADKQVAILTKWMDARALKSMLDNLDEGPKHTKQLLDAYIAGDDVKIVALGDDERADSKKSGYTDAELDQQSDELLYSRNASWIAGIEKLHAAGGGFVAVGAMHLVGKKSVLEMLAAKGFKIGRVTP